MLASVAEGRVPEDQKGFADLRLEAWPAFTAANPKSP